MGNRPVAESDPEPVSSMRSSLRQVMHAWRLDDCITDGAAVEFLVFYMLEHEHQTP